MFSFPLERGVRTGWKTISSAIPAVPSGILSQYNHILHSRIRQRSKKHTGTKETGSGRLLLHIFRGIVVCGRRHFWYNFFIVLFHGLFFFWEGQRMYTTKKKRKTQQSTKRKEEDLEVSFFKQEKKKTNAEKQIPRKRRRKEDIVDVRPSEIQWCYSEWGTSRVPSILPLNCFVFSSFSAVEATILYKMPVLTKVLIPFDKTRENRACTA